jgi:hypothetical protein
MAPEIRFDNYFTPQVYDEVITDADYPQPPESEMDIDEAAAAMAKVAYTDDLIDNGRPLSDFVPRTFRERFMMERDFRLQHVADMLADHGDAWFDDLFTHYVNAVTAVATATTFHDMGDAYKAVDHWDQAHAADEAMGRMIRHAIDFYIRDMEEKENA